MNIENGDYFVVTKGAPYNMDMVNTLFGISDRPQKQHFDRSHEGRVFRALEVCGNVIAAKIVYSSKVADKEVGKTISLHAENLEIWPVTEKYFKVLEGTAARGQLENI